MEISLIKEKGKIYYTHTEWKLQRGSVERQHVQIALSLARVVSTCSEFPESAL